MAGIFIAAPPVQAPARGLFQVAPPTEVSDVHEFYMGIEYQAEICGVASTVPDRCFDAYAVLTDDGGEVKVTVFNVPEGSYILVLDDESGDAITEDGPNPEFEVGEVEAGEHSVVVTGPNGLVIVEMSWTSPLEGEAEPVSSAVKNFDGIDYVHGTPFTIYKGIECGLFNYEEYAPKARRALELGRQRAIEEHLWTQVLPDIAVDLSDVGGAPSLQEAVGVLEEYAGSVYSGIPVLHAGLGTSIALGANWIVGGLAAPLTTVNATPLVNGAGYVGLVGPGGEVAGDGEAWIYITGQLTVRLSPITVSEAPAYAINRHQALAEEKVIVTVECFAAAIRASLE